MSNGDDSYETYLMNADGAGSRRLIANQADGYPTWASDGQFIAFMSHRNGNWDIYKIDLKSDQITRLTSDPALDLNPAWSPQ